MVKDNLTIPFKMFCITDNPDNIYSEIEIIPHEYEYGGWVNKHIIFEKSYKHLKGRVLYLDLDMIIQNNIDDMIWYQPEGICVAHCNWKPKHLVNEVELDVVWNSSIATWNAEDIKYVLDNFDENKDFILNEYKGVDRILYWEEEIRKTVGCFPDDWCYSRIWGDGVTDGQVETGVYAWHFGEYKMVYLYDRPEYKVCLLNGMSMVDLTEEVIIGDLKRYYE